MNNTTENVKTKACTGCKEQTPRTTEFFYTDKRRDDGLYSKCKKCIQKDRERNKEKKKEYDKSYFAKNAEKMKRKHKEYTFKNEEKLRVKQKAYRESNSERISTSKKTWYENNKQHHIEVTASWRRNNTDKVHVFQQRYRSRKRRVDCSFTEEQWVRCRHTFNNKCAYCGNSEKLTQDHFVPVSKGGEYTLNNIIPACHSCNSSKNDTEFIQWYRTKKFYSAKREKKILSYLRYENNTQQLALL